MQRGRCDGGGQTRRANPKHNDQGYKPHGCEIGSTAEGVRDGKMESREMEWRAIYSQVWQRSVREEETRWVEGGCSPRRQMWEGRRERRQSGGEKSRVTGGEQGTPQEYARRVQPSSAHGDDARGISRVSAHTPGVASWLKEAQGGEQARRELQTAATTHSSASRDSERLGHGPFAAAVRGVRRCRSVLRRRCSFCVSLRKRGGERRRWEGRGGRWHRGRRAYLVWPSKKRRKRRPRASGRALHGTGGTVQRGEGTPTRCSAKRRSTSVQRLPAPRNASA